MKKIDLIELVEDFLTGGDAPDDVKGRFHPEIIKKHIELEFRSLVFDVFLEAKRFSDYSILDSWTKKYTIGITPLNGKADAVLPYPPMQLPDNLGIRLVCTTDSPSSAYAYRENNSHAIFSELAISRISTRPFFTIEQNDGDGNETHILKLEQIPTGVTSIDVRMIVPLDYIDDYDDISIPAGKETVLVNGVIERLAGKPSEDLINDNKPGT